MRLGQTTQSILEKVGKSEKRTATVNVSSGRKYFITAYSLAEVIDEGTNSVLLPKSVIPVIPYNDWLDTIDRFDEYLTQKCSNATNDGSRGIVKLSEYNILRIVLDDMVYVVSAYDPTGNQRATSYGLSKGLRPQQEVEQESLLRKKEAVSGVVISSHDNINLAISFQSDSNYFDERGCIYYKDLLRCMEEHEALCLIDNINSVLAYVSSASGESYSSGKTSYIAAADNIIGKVIEIYHGLGIESGTGTFRLPNIGYIIVSLLAFPNPVKKGDFQLMAPKKWEKWMINTPGMVKLIEE